MQDNPEKREEGEVEQHATNNNTPVVARFLLKMIIYLVFLLQFFF
jgi:hypothetical protein